MVVFRRTDRGILNAADDSAAAADNSYSVAAQSCVRNRVDCRLMDYSMNAAVPVPASPDSECMDGRYSESCTFAAAVADSDDVMMRKLVAKAVQV